MQDVAAAYRTVIQELYDAGCRNIQFDDCTWGMFCDSNYWNARQNDNVSLESEAEKYLRVNNLAMEGPLQPMYAAAIIIPHTLAPAHTMLSHRTCLQTKRQTPFIWSSMTNAPAVSSHSGTWHRTNKLSSV